MEANGKKMHIKQCMCAQFSVQPLLILLTLAPNRVSSAKLEIRIGQTESQRIGAVGVYYELKIKQTA